MLAGRPLGSCFLFGCCPKRKSHLCLSVSRQPDAAGLMRHSNGLAIIAYDRDWFGTDSTEKRSLDLLRRRRWPTNDASYFAFPWTSLINAMRYGKHDATPLILQLEKLCGRAHWGRLMTVCNHAGFRQHLDVLQRAGLTDIFTAHALPGELVCGGINIHPFPIYPRCIPDRTPWALTRSQRIHNFSARPYLHSAQDASDGAESTTLQDARKRLAATRFAVIPSNDGTNLATLWEAIEYGCIPVLLSPEWRLPGERALWKAACVFVPQSDRAANDLQSTLEALDRDRPKLEQKLSALRQIWGRYGRGALVSDVLKLAAQGFHTDRAQVRNPERRSLTFFCSIEYTDDTVAWRWLQFLDQCCRAVGLTADVYLDRTAGHRLSQRYRGLKNLNVSKAARDCILSHDWARHDLITVADSAVLSRPLLERFSRFHVLCDRLPERLNPSLASAFLDDGTNTGRNDARESDHTDAQRLYRRWRPACSLITSMYDGHDFVQHFLTNSAELDRYDDIEHFIVLPASPGREHDHVYTHVQSHGNCVYIWLPTDPRLYGVWNLCCRLASAPYLSNANIDDRRAPQHVQCLAQILDENADIDVASSPLRVTTTNNLTWSESAHSEVWWGSESFGEYAVEHLVQCRRGRWVPNNIPHCMPLWRKRLHAQYGYFDEQSFGPSADWEFWLRVGSKGTRFYLSKEPLGLYLRFEDSYWRRSAAVEKSERRIMATYLRGLAMGQPDAVHRPLGRRVARLIEARDAGDWPAYANGLIALALDTWTHPLKLPSLEALIRKLLARDFGLTAWERIAYLFFLDTSASRPGVIDGPSRLVVEALESQHEFGIGHERIMRNLEQTIRRDDVEKQDVAVLLVMARVAHTKGDERGEQALLERAYLLDRRVFWMKLQSAYRFERSLAEISRSLPSLPPFTNVRDIEPGRRVFVLTGCLRGNADQTLLYRSHDRSGAVQIPIESISVLTTGQAHFDPGDVLHIHGIEELTDVIEADRDAAIFDKFLADVQGLKAEGMRVDWAVNSGYSKNRKDIKGECSFQRRLAGLANTIILRHPCLLDEVSEWLPEDANVRFLEHGNSIGVSGNRLSRAQARQPLGLKETDFVICSVGDIRPQDDLAKIFPRLRNVMADNPSLKLLLAGRIGCNRTRAEVRNIPVARALIEDKFVAASDVQRYLSAADFLLLPYRDVVSAGNLFQAFSFGVPVIAPSLGCLPAYVVNNWNGLLYSDEEQLGGLLGSLAALPAGMMHYLRCNALRTAEALHWPASIGRL